MDNEIPSPVAGPAAVVREREPGGVFPNIGDLFQESLTEFLDAIGPYLIAMLGLLAGYLIVGIAGAVLFGGLVLVVGLLAGALAMAGEELGSGAASLLGLLSVVLNLVVIAVTVIGSIALTAPLNASFMRAVAAHQRGDEELQIAAAFSTLTEDLPRVIGIGALVGVASLVAMAFCFFPILLVPLFLGFSIPLVALHRMRATEAAQTNIAHVRDHLQEHAVIAIVVFALNLVSGMIPVVGPAFVTAFVVRAYRKIFGDGESPQLALTDQSA